MTTTLILAGRALVLPHMSSEVARYVTMAVAAIGAKGRRISDPVALARSIVGRLSGPGHLAAARVEMDKWARVRYPSEPRIEDVLDVIVFGYRFAYDGSRASDHGRDVDPACQAALDAIVGHPLAAHDLSCGICEAATRRDWDEALGRVGSFREVRRSILDLYAMAARGGLMPTLDPSSNAAPAPTPTDVYDAHPAEVF